MNVEEFVQNSISRSLSKYLELHPDVSIPTYVGSGWGVAKQGAVSISSSSPATVSLADTSITSANDYQVVTQSQSTRGSDSWVRKEATSFEIRTSETNAVTVYYAVFAKGYGGVPNGGTTGQVLAKKSGADGDTEWRDVLILESPNGTKYKLIVLNDGTLSTEAV